MKKSSKILAVLATIGLTTAAAVPAMAFENEFHGMFAARYINSNFNGTATTDFGPGDGSYDPTGTTKKQYSANFVEQRARLQYIAKASEDLKLVTHFELDYSYWGNSSYAVGRNGGGAIGADQVNLETKSIYLDANIFKNINMKLGMMPSDDAFKGVLFGADAAGILLSSQYGKFSPSIGYYRYNASTKDNVYGHLTNDLFLLDGKFAVNSNLTLGAAYYLFRDNFDGNDVKMNTFGLNAEYKNGPLTLNGFAIYQTGWNSYFGTTAYTSAFAGNVGAKIKAGRGTARAEFLYVTGAADDGRNGFYSVSNHWGGAEHGYYDNEMAILGRDKNAYTTDNSLLYSAGNKNQGQMGLYLGYDLPINDRLTTAFNVGFAGVTHKNMNRTATNNANVNGSNYLGTEINAEANYKLLNNLNVGVRAAYVVLGGYYNNTAINGTPDNPYDCKVMFKYSF